MVGAAVENGGCISLQQWADHELEAGVAANTKTDPRDRRVSTTALGNIGALEIECITALAMGSSWAAKASIQAFAEHRRDRK